MTRLRIRLAIAAAFGAVAISITAAAAHASSSGPPLGSWSLGNSTGFVASGSGFTLKKGKGSEKSQVLLGGFHLELTAEPPCEAPPDAIVKLPGSFALKQYGRAGVTAWGIGKNLGGEPYYAPTPVLVDGKSVKGYFYMLWNYSDPSVVMRGGVAFGSCTLEFNGGAPRSPLRGRSRRPAHGSSPAAASSWAPGRAASSSSPPSRPPPRAPALLGPEAGHHGDMRHQRFLSQVAVG